MTITAEKAKELNLKAEERIVRKKVRTTGDHFKVIGAREVRYVSEWK
jgi:hypothetical protein